MMRPVPIHFLMFNKRIVLQKALDTLARVERRQQEIQDYLFNGEALPRPLLATLRDTENDLQQLRHGLDMAR